MKKIYEASLLGKFKGWLSLNRRSYDTEILFYSKSIQVTNANQTFEIVFEGLKDLIIYKDYEDRKSVV